MERGISIYPMESENSAARAESYLDLAASMGYTRVFTSLHMPEVDYAQHFRKLQAIFQSARAHGMLVTADISPASLSQLNEGYKDWRMGLQTIGVDEIRVDYGIGLDRLAEWSASGIRIQLNASTLTETELERLARNNVDLSRFGAFHNFYPRPYTGLSFETFRAKTLQMKSYGLEVSAFIPSGNRTGRRGPLYEGLPTVEAHRHMNTAVAARQLMYSGLADTLYFGDSFASEEELAQVAAADVDAVELKIDFVAGIPAELAHSVLAADHTNRPDASDYVIRSEESRGYAQLGRDIERFNPTVRRKYAVTIDNVGMLRYSGELQICLVDLPEDDRVNVVGYIAKESECLLECIKPGGRFRFIAAEDIR